MELSAKDFLQNSQVHIIDLKDKQGNATGTKVELIIPF
jgi:hypothetical protein